MPSESSSARSEGFQIARSHRSDVLVRDGSQKRLVVVVDASNLAPDAMENETRYFCRLTEDEKLSVLARVERSGSVRMMASVLKGNFSDLAISASEAVREKYAHWQVVAKKGWPLRPNGARAPEHVYIKDAVPVVFRIDDAAVRLYAALFISTIATPNAV